MNKQTTLRFDPSMFGPFFIKKKIVIIRTLLVTMKDLVVRVIRTSKIDDYYFDNPDLLREAVEKILGENVLRIEPIEIENW